MDKGAFAWVWKVKVDESSVGFKQLQLGSGIWDPQEGPIASGTGQAGRLSPDSSSGARTYLKVRGGSVL